MAATASKASARPTRKILDGRYEVLGIVGRGSRSVVYHARHVASPTSEVALKVLVDRKDELLSSDKLRKEALAMVSARHRYVLRLDDFHSMGQLCYLCLEYAPLSDLRKYMQGIGGRLDPQSGARFLLQCAEGLSFVHRAGIIHRDIKPDNLLVINHEEIRIGDFGIALLPGEQSSLEELQAGVGTMSYMAPEVLEGREYDHRADIYALGVTFYEALSGAHPFDGAPLLKQLDVRRDEYVTPLSQLAPEIPEFLSQTIAAMMSYDSAVRLSDASEIARCIKEQRAPGTGFGEPQPAAEGRGDPLASILGVGEHEQPHYSNDDGSYDDEQGELGPEDTQSFQSSDSTEEAQLPRPDFAEPADDQEEQFQTGGFRESLRRGSELQGEPAASEELAEERELHQRHQPARNGELRQRRRSPLAMMLPAILLTAAAFVITMKVLAPAQPAAPTAVRPIKGKPAVVQENLATTEAALPNFSAGEPAFPFLPEGRYAGTITGLVPGISLPFSVLSFDGGASLTFVVGMNGWTPRTVDVSGLISSDQPVDKPEVRVASNGFVLLFTAEDALSGSFVNRISGDNGKWKLERVG